MSTLDLGKQERWELVQVALSSLSLASEVASDLGLSTATDLRSAYRRLQKEAFMLGLGSPTSLWADSGGTSN